MKYSIHPSELPRVDNQLRNETVMSNGVIRWVSSGNVPPQEYLERAAEIGVFFSMEASMAAREADTNRFLDEYRRRNTGRKLTAEERFEMRAAHGPGKRVVNVITGDVYET